MSEQIPWHRVFGLAWMDFFRGLPVTVEMEKDLSLKQQRLDVVLIRKQAVHLPYPLPDGFADLAPYNLVSFKSYQDKLSAFSLQELVSHYVNLRKQESPSMDEDDLLAADQFRLFAVSARYPQQLASDPLIHLQRIAAGVYDVEGLGLRIRIVVPNQLALQEHNAMMHMFSARADLLEYGRRHYRIRSTETSSLLRLVFEKYLKEKLTMPDLLEELTRETIDQLIKELPVEERLKGLSAEDLRKRLSLEERLEGLSPEERLGGLSPEERLGDFPLRICALPWKRRSAGCKTATRLQSRSKPPASDHPSMPYVEAGPPLRIRFLKDAPQFLLSGASHGGIPVPKSGLSSRPGLWRRRWDDRRVPRARQLRAGCGHGRRRPLPSAGWRVDGRAPRWRSAWRRALWNGGASIRWTRCAGTAVGTKTATSAARAAVSTSA